MPELYNQQYRLAECIKKEKTPVFADYKKHVSSKDAHSLKVKKIEKGITHQLKGKMSSCRHPNIRKKRLHHKRKAKKK